VGIVGLYAPEVFGVGYDAIERVLHNQVVLSGGLILLVAKIIATSLTLGSGASGGVFAPSLFIGAMLGGAFGDLAHRWFPNITAQSGAYTLVGMAAVFAAAARAPMTAVIILFEMTGDYRIILPLMLSAVIATTLAGPLESESIYTLKLSRRGTQVEQGRDIDVMQSVRISEVLTTDITPVAGSATLRETAQHFQANRRKAFPVVDHNGTLLGVVRRHDIVKAYTLGPMRRQQLQTRVPQMQVRYGSDARFVELELTGDASAAGVALATLSLPRACVIVSIRRGDTVLEWGDKVTAFVTAEDEPKLKKRLFSPKLSA
jgi:CIC family chloride channel protein